VWILRRCGNAHVAGDLQLWDRERCMVPYVSKLIYISSTECGKALHCEVCLCHLAVLFYCTAGYVFQQYGIRRFRHSTNRPILYGPLKPPLCTLRTVVSNARKQRILAVPAPPAVLCTCRASAKVQVPICACCSCLLCGPSARSTVNWAQPLPRSAPRAHPGCAISDNMGTSLANGSRSIFWTDPLE
jgi:hypothetical protein